jgi:hypothetical protein
MLLGDMCQGEISIHFLQVRLSDRGAGSRNMILRRYCSDAILRFASGFQSPAHTVVLHPIITRFLFRGTPIEPRGWDWTELSFLMVAGRPDQKMRLIAV